MLYLLTNNFQVMNQTLTESLQTALSSLDSVLKSVHEKDSLMHFVSEEEVSYAAVTWHDTTEHCVEFKDKSQTSTTNVHLFLTNNENFVLQEEKNKRKVSGHMLSSWWKNNYRFFFNIVYGTGIYF